MGDTPETLGSQCCVRCLATPKDCNLQQFVLKCDSLKSIFEANWLILCYICQRLLQKTESFIQNVRENQILLESYEGDHLSLKNIRSKIQPICVTNSLTRHIINMTGDDPVDEESPIPHTSLLPHVTVLPNTTVLPETTVIPQIFHEVKVEMKEETEDLDGDNMSYDDDDYQEPLIKKALVTPLKREEPPPLIWPKKDKKVTPSKEKVSKGKVSDNKDFEDNESDTDSDDFTPLSARVTKKPGKAGKSQPSTPAKQDKKKNDSVLSKILCIELTKKQWLEERQKIEKSERYNNCHYKCTDCMKSFVLKSSYEVHMKKHSLSNGDYVCDFCNMIWDTREKLKGHIKGHIQRFKCPGCDFIRGTKKHVAEHYTRHHGVCQPNECPDCKKVYAGRLSLQKHIYMAHKRGRQRFNCDLCSKTFATKHGLVSHQIRRHPKDSSSEDVNKQWACKECGSAFIKRSQLIQHSRAHNETREHYCVECNKYFKTLTSLQTHLKYTGIHKSSTELPLKCEYCDQRFIIRRTLEQHTNHVHLNIKPYACDKCDKAYVSKWSLNTHNRVVHEGYKSPLAYPCPMCDRLFGKRAILKNHIRTHTGERPFQCPQCSATFSQTSALGTHVKLVHLKLTRGGRPKNTAH